MNRRSLVRNLAQQLDCTQREASSFLEGFIQVVSHNLIREESITLVNFGSFVPFQKKARTVRIPLTDNKVIIPQHTAIRFKASKNLLNAVMNK